MVVSTACGSDTKKWRVQLQPTGTINQDDAGASLPVLVRVYQLKGKDKFQQATFKMLWKNEKDALEGDLLDRKEITVHPETNADLYLDVDLKHGAAFLGVMALFRQPDVDGWRQIIEAKSSALNPMTPKMKLVLDKSTIKLVE